MNKFLEDPRFAGIKPVENKVWLSSPTMHGDEQKCVDSAIEAADQLSEKYVINSIVAEGGVIVVGLNKDTE